jgi:OmpR family response regulator RpaB
VYSILLIDDDKRLALLLSEFFVRYDLQLLSETQPSMGMSRLENDAIDLVILDIMLPESDGFDVCRQIRKNSAVPILMLTARGDVMDRVVGLELGADDYMSKPFEPRELVARIHNILKRVGTENMNQRPVLAWPNFVIDKQYRQARYKKRDLMLSSKEFALLLLLAENPDRTYDRDEIMNEISGIDAELFSRSIDILVSRLRQKLKPLNCIQTLHGRGYRFLPPDRKA